MFDQSNTHEEEFTNGAEILAKRQIRMQNELSIDQNRRFNQKDEAIILAIIIAYWRDTEPENLQIMSEHQKVDTPSMSFKFSFVSTSSLSPKEQKLSLWIPSVYGRYCASSVQYLDCAVISGYETIIKDPDPDSMERWRYALIPVAPSNLIGKCFMYGSYWPAPTTAKEPQQLNARQHHEFVSDLLAQVSISKREELTRHITLSTSSFPTCQTCYKEKPFVLYSWYRCWDCVMLKKHLVKFACVVWI